MHPLSASVAFASLSCFVTYFSSDAFGESPKSLVHPLQDALTIQAEEFSSHKNVSVVQDGDGARIGIVTRTQTDSTDVASAIWSFRTIEEGTYLLEFRYASSEKRPGQLSLNGNTVSQNSMGLETGGGSTRRQSWTIQGVFEFEKGVNQLEFQSKGDWANLDAIRLTLRKDNKQLTEEEYAKRCTKSSSCETYVGRTCSFESGRFGPGVTEEQYTQEKRPSAEQFCGVDTYYKVPRKCGYGSQIDAKIANPKDVYDMCGLLRVNRDFCLNERFQNYRFSSFGPESGKTGQDICDSLLEEFKQANIFLLYR
ncbi:MAG: hypothetical protein VX278_10855 [Myxococcota bacterium]|nr:hypothetical protein [Myxococcota bacterium]